MFHGHFRDFNIIILLMLTQPPSPHPCFWNTDANDYFSFSAVLHWLSLMSGRWIIAESDPFIHYSPFICINKITFIFQFLACLSSFLLFFFFMSPFSSSPLSLGKLILPFCSWFSCTISGAFRHFPPLL